jgi:hypothetical protein
MKRILSIRITDAQREWLQSRAERTGVEMGRQIRQMVSACMVEEERQRERARWLQADIASTRVLLDTLGDGEVMERARLSRRLAEHERELEGLR